MTINPACWLLVHYQGKDALQKQLVKLESLLNKNNNKKNQTFTLTSGWQNQISQEHTQRSLLRVQRYLHSGDCYQINLTHRFEADYQGDEWQAYIELRKTNKAPFSAFIRLENASILSISPERFVQLVDRDIQTKPIKGTRPRFSNPAQDSESAMALSLATKDRAENLMIVDLLRTISVRWHKQVL